MMMCQNTLRKQLSFALWAFLNMLSSFATYLVGNWGGRAMSAVKWPSPPDSSDRWHRNMVTSLAPLAVKCIASGKGFLRNISHVHFNFLFRVTMKFFLRNFSNGEATLCQLVLWINSKRRLLSAWPPKGSLFKSQENPKSKALHWVQDLQASFKETSHSSPFWSSCKLNTLISWYLLSCPGVLRSPFLPHQCSCWANQDLP